MLECAPGDDVATVVAAYIPDGKVGRADLAIRTTSISDSKMEATMFRTIALLRNPLRTAVLTLAALCASAVFFSVEQKAQTSKRPLELKDYLRIEVADSPAISPDGRWVAFVRSYVVEAENRRQSEIWLVPSDGSAAPTRITNPAFSSSGPRWSPDGKLLAFVSRRKVPDGDESNPIWFLRMDQPGGEAFQIRGVNGTPVFSPDNQWIAFTKRTYSSTRPSKQYDSDFERQINERFKGRAVDWMNYRFDGRGYLPDPRDPNATPPEELYVVPRAGGAPKQITKLGVNVESAAWSPDGKSLVIEANAHQRDEYQYERSDLWIVTLDGEVKRLTDDGYNHGNPTWSPDGRSIVFTRAQSLSQVIAAKQNHGSPLDVSRMPVDGGKMENLTAGWDLLPRAPAFSA
ncbi:MAG: TolB family protein, partial [Blastocatellia bacterium]